MEKQFIAKIDDVPDGQAKDFSYQGQPAILIHYDNEFHAFVNICTHEQGLCVLAGDVLQCTVHESQFDPKTGQALQGPADLDSYLTHIPIEIENDQIFVAS